MCPVGMVCGPDWVFMLVVLALIFCIVVLALPSDMSDQDKK